MCIRDSIIDIVVILVLVVSILIVTLSLTSKSSGVPNLFGVAPLSVQSNSMANMSKEDIDKAVREAEQYAAEDAKRKEEIDTRNQGDQMVMCCSLPVPRSLAETFTMPLASMSNVRCV